MACNNGLLSINHGLLYGIVACYFRLLGVPGCYYRLLAFQVALKYGLLAFPVRGSRWTFRDCRSWLWGLSVRGPLRIQGWGTCRCGAFLESHMADNLVLPGKPSSPKERATIPQSSP